MKQTIREIKPLHPSVANLIASQTRVKPRKKDKGKSVIVACPDDPGYFVYFQPVFPSDGSSFWNVKIVEEVGPNELVAHQVRTESFQRSGVGMDSLCSPLP